MTENNNIPKHWQRKKLGEVCTYSKGKKPVVLKDTKNKDCIVPYINIKAFEKGIISEYTNGVKCNICNDDDLLMVWDGARCGLIGKAKKGAVGSTLMKILPKENIHKEYLYHFISSKFWTLNTKPKGVGIPHIEPTLLWNFELVVPPLPEQLTIVSKIEELFSELDNGITQLKTAQQQLKVYRQSLLKWAFEGKLTSSITNEKLRITNDGLPKGWKLNELGDVSDMCLGKMLDKKKNKGNYQPYLRNISVRWGHFDLSDLEEMRFETHEEERYSLKNGDLIICEGGEPGRCAIWKGIIPNMKIQKALHRVRVKNMVSEIYLYHYMFYAAKSGLLKKYFTGTTIKHLTGRELKKIEIPLPSIKEQNFIVDELESKLTVCDKIEETISQSLQQAETLRQSILKKAFEEKLVRSILEHTT